MYDDCMEIQPQELAASIERHDAPVVLDVRSGPEFSSGHVPGARHLPFWSVLFRAGGIPGDRRDPLVVYCGHGPRAEMAAAALRLRGFTDVRLLRGHWAKWRAAGLPVER